MKYLLSQRFRTSLVSITDAIFSIFILVSIFALIIYSGLTVYDLFGGEGGIAGKNIVHNIAYIVVLLKAYKILTFYLESHNLSIKYLVQISIIAPAIELIFAAEAQPYWLNILFAAYSLANLYIYLRYNEKLDKLNIIKDAE